MYVRRDEHEDPEDIARATAKLRRAVKEASAALGEAPATTKARFSVGGESVTTLIPKLLFASAFSFVVGVVVKSVTTRVTGRKRRS